LVDIPYLQLKDLIPIFFQLITIVQKLHLQGNAHRDIKPQNFICIDNTIKLGDFGCAIFTTTSTISNSLLGTRSYMAPEVGDSVHHKEYNPYLADIFSLGKSFAKLLKKCGIVNEKIEQLIQDMTIADPYKRHSSDRVKIDLIAIQNSLLIMDEAVLPDIIKRIMIFSKVHRIIKTKLVDIKLMKDQAALEMIYKLEESLFKSKKLE